MKDLKQEMLCSSFYTEAKFSGRFDAVKKSMASLPNSILLSEGTVLKYAITENKADRPINALLELGRNSLTYTYYFEKDNRHNKNINLIAFLSLLSYLQDFYEIRLAALYAPIIDAVSGASLMLKNDLNNFDSGQSTRIEELSKCNCTLSHQIKMMADSKSRLENDLGIYRAVCIEVIERYSHGEIVSAAGISNTLIQLGISNKLASDAGQLLKSVLKTVID